MNTATTRNDHNRISPTAKITAYWRSFSSIPYSKEIAEAVASEETARKLIGDSIVTRGTISPPMFEARYKTINAGLELTGIENVMELACGLSPRGLEIVSKGGTYIGTDLPEMSAESSRIIMEIAVRENIPVNNLHVQPANVLNPEEMENAAAIFGGMKFAICNEGLLPYLSKDEKARMAGNVRSLLLRVDGSWITMDPVFKVLREAIATMFGEKGREAIRPALNKIIDQTGRDILANDFEDKSQAAKFYQDLGFEIEEFPMYDGSYELSTISMIPESGRRKFLDIISNAKTWIMTPKP